MTDGGRRADAAIITAATAYSGSGARKPFNRSKSYTALIPLELLDGILRCVQDEDRRRLHLAPLASRRSVPLDLTTCRLVSRRWNAIATPRLFARTVVSKGGGKTFENFVRFLLTSPAAAGQIRVLRLTVWTPSEVEAALSAKTLKAMLPYLPRLEELQLDGIRLVPALDRRRRKSSVHVLNLRKALRAYLQIIRLNSIKPFVHPGRVKLPSVRSVFMLRKLSLRKVRVNQDHLNELGSLMSIFSAIDVVTLEEVHVNDGFGPWMDDSYSMTIPRTNQLLFKELHIRETSADYILPLLEKTTSFRKFASLTMRLDLYHDAPRLAWLLSQPSNPGMNLTELTFDLNGIPWKRSSLSLHEHSE